MFLSVYKVKVYPLFEVRTADWPWTPSMVRTNLGRGRCGCQDYTSKLYFTDYFNSRADPRSNPSMFFSILNSVCNAGWPDQTHAARLLSCVWNAISRHSAQNIEICVLPYFPGYPWFRITCVVRWQEIPQSSITKISLKCIFFKCHWILPEANWVKLRISVPRWYQLKAKHYSIHSLSNISINFRWYLLLVV